MSGTGVTRSSDGSALRSRLLVTYRISVSALAIMHSPRSADFRWPRSRRRQTTPPHSRSSNRLKQETARQPANTSEVEFPRDRGQGQQQCRSLWRWWRTDDNRLWVLEFRSRQPEADHSVTAELHSD